VTAAATAGKSTVLFVGDKPALLATAKGVTASGAGPAAWKIDDAGQSVLTAD